VGGIPEVVLHGQTGLLTPADDVAAFSAALLQMMNDPALRMRFGTAAKKRVQENFTSDQMGRQFEKVYSELAAIPRKELGWAKAMQNLVVPYSRLFRLRKHPSRPRYNV
jgi:hypothetical protein